MSKTSDAINHANDTLSMVYVAPRQWAIRTYCPDRHAWIEGPSMPYQQALMHYAEARHIAALEYMGWNTWDATCAAAKVKGSLLIRIADSL